MHNPITQSFLTSDITGKLIFLSLFLLSIISWSLIIYRSWQLWQVQKSNEAFKHYFENNKHKVLGLNPVQEGIADGPMVDIYHHLCRYTLDLLAKNRRFGAVDPDTSSAYLSMDDVHVISEKASQEVLGSMHRLEAHIHHLSTIVTLSPFLGLLGTVWGILTSFGSMQSPSMSNDAILSGLSMALATTVVGLVVAIPALVGYNVLKTWLRKFDSSLSGFCAEAINVIELQYRKVEKF